MKIKKISRRKNKKKNTIQNLNFKKSINRIQFDNHQLNSFLFWRFISDNNMIILFYCIYIYIDDIYFNIIIENHHCHYYDYDNDDDCYDYKYDYNDVPF